jgi:hypothetical protein
MSEEQKRVLENECRAETLRLCKSRDAMLKGIAAGIVERILARIQNTFKRTLQ